MRPLVYVAAVAVCLLATDSIAEARKDGWVTFKGRSGAEELIVHGATWRCQDGACRTRRLKSAPAAEVCRTLARRLGAEITGFGYRGDAFDAEALAACNAK